MNKLSRNKKNTSRWRCIVSPVKQGNTSFSKYREACRWKIRGWKRRVKFVQAWGKHISEPSFQSWYGKKPFSFDRFTYSPWYRFYKHRQPPLWFFRIIIQQFVNNFDNWEAIFIANNEPFDLFIEIHDPNYIVSEIECVKMSYQGEKYQYHPPVKVNRPFQFNKFQSKDYDLTRFNWELCVEEHFVFESELEDRETTREILLNKGYEEQENRHGVFFAKKIGDVWMGRKARNNE